MAACVVGRSSFYAMANGRGTNCPTGALFYTCAGNQFRGCCSTDPCQSMNGCEDTLIPTKITTLAPFTAQSTSETPTSKSSLFTSTAVWATTITSPPAAFTSTWAISTTPFPEGTLPRKLSEKLSVGLIAGLSVGIGVLAIASLGLFICRRWIGLSFDSSPGSEIREDTACLLPPAHVFELEGSSVCDRVNAGIHNGEASIATKSEGSDRTRQEMAG
ncbi:hypothetical protein F4678DRAFT_452856 [Xylaria arbuscula]|nr:hypothetical protein F4678DRAFT_452856 [Xylaria arbuscula]